MRQLLFMVLGLTALAGCKKSADKTPEAPTGGPAAPAFPAAKPAPPFMAYVPADTPYVFASLEPIPRSYWTKLGAAFGPDADALLDKALAEPASTPAEKFGQALVRELKGNLNEAGIKKLFGIDSSARGAFYGLGLVPAVVRWELADPAALPATVERLAKESGLELPRQTHQGKDYYRFGDADVSVVGAVADGQLVVAIGPTATIEKALPHVLGLEKPAKNMSDGGRLKEVIAAHGYGPWAGFVDSKRVVELVAAEKYFSPAAPPPEACTPALTAAAARVPMLSFGYHEWTDKRVAGKMMVDMEPALAGRLAALVTEVPGLVNGPLPGRPLFAFGAGVNLDAGRKLAADFLGEIGRLATTCGNADVERELGEMVAMLGQPLPPALANARGLVASVLDVRMGQGAPPSGDGYAIIAAAEPGALLDQIQQIAPLPALASLPRDGKFHEVAPAEQTGGIGAVRVAVKPKALAAIVGGDAAEKAVEAALAQPAGKSPLFAFAYDYGRFMNLIFSAMPNQDPSAAMVKRFAGMMGLVTMWATPTDKGLSIGMTMEMN
jgi:hypothetical protein